MKVVILCGGQGTRLREETEFRPKPMVKIGTKPILWHIMMIYAHYGLKNFVLCLGYKGEVIKEYFRNYHWNTSDVTLTLGSAPKIKYHGRHGTWRGGLPQGCRAGFRCVCGPLRSCLTHHCSIQRLSGT